MVDDSVRWHRLYESAILEEFPGARVEFASNGREGLAKLTAHEPPDLMILDLDMPIMCGDDVLAQVRRESRWDHMLVLILTGESDVRRQSQLLDLGADDFIEKGTDPELLTSRIRTHLRHKALLDQLTSMGLDSDMFAAGVLHDIRNMEASITAISHMIDMELDETNVSLEKIIGLFEAADGQASQLGLYAKDVINMVRAFDVPEQSPIDLRSILAWSRGVVTIEITTSKDFETGAAAWVTGDPSALKLVFLNVLQNSVKYALPGVPAHVVVDTEKVAPDRMIIRLRDKGRGVAPGELRSMFEPFKRGSSAHDLETGNDSPGASGWGLGLAVVSRAVQRMGGRIWAEAPQDKGAGVCICLELSTPVHGESPL
jgi:signal transduction histidine kinase